MTALPVGARVQHVTSGRTGVIAEVRRYLLTRRPRYVIQWDDGRRYSSSREGLRPTEATR